MKLDGIRVLDLTRFLPGPWIGQTMADHGAEVIKLESLEGEPTRHIGTAIDGQTAYFRNTQRGKRSLCVNLKAKAGREIALRLAASADVVLESFRPGVVARLGLDYAAVRERRADIVYCSLSAFGQDGELAARPSHDLGAEALAGVLSLSRRGDAAPTLPTLPVADIALGSAALVAILMALLRRTRSGEGDFIDAAMLDALVAWTPHMLDAVLAHDRAPQVDSERLLGGSACYDIYRTADAQYIVLSGAEPAFVENLLRALGRSDLLCHRDAPAGSAGQAELRNALTAIFATRSREHWDRWLADKNVCYAAVLDLHEAWQTPWLRARGMIVAGDDGVEHLGTPLRFAHEPGRPGAHAPALGEHTDELLEGVGYDRAQRQTLRAAGVIG